MHTIRHWMHTGRHALIRDKSKDTQATTFPTVRCPGHNQPKLGHPNTHTAQSVKTPMTACHWRIGGVSRFPTYSFSCSFWRKLPNNRLVLPLYHLAPQPPGKSWICRRVYRTYVLSLKVLVKWWNFSPTLQVEVRFLLWIRVGSFSHKLSFLLKMNQFPDTGNIFGLESHFLRYSCVVNCGHIDFIAPSYKCTWHVYVTEKKINLTGSKILINWGQNRKNLDTTQVIGTSQLELERRQRGENKK